jgi:hypothetical protein
MIPEIDYIIPISNPGGIEYEERLETLRYFFNVFLPRQTGVMINVLVVEQAVDPDRELFFQRATVGSESNIKFLRVCNPVLNKNWLYNIGLRQSRNPHVFISDMDCVYLEDRLKEVIEFAVADQMKWCIAWDAIHYAGPRCKSAIIADGSVDWSDCATVPKKTIEYDGYEGGIVYFLRKFLIGELGGCNEFFKYLGGADNSLAHRARMTSGKNIRFKSDLFHLHHSLSPMKSSPLRVFNKQLLAYVRRNVVTCNLVMRKMWINGVSGRVDSPACDRTSWDKELSGAL